jgi:predicted SnoaL-like aldol condensation-catalyzing enzyme
MSGTLEGWIEAYRTAWEEGDAEAAAGLFTPEATYRSNIVEEPHRGREGVHSYWEGVTSAQSEAEVRMGRPFVDGRRVAVEFWTNMRVDGEQVTLPGCLLLDFDEDWKCTRLREYWNYLPGDFRPPPEWGQ